MSCVAEAQSKGAQIVVTRDLHPPDHQSFAAFGGQWPQHCVRGTPGAELHPGLRLPSGALFVAKARRAEREQTSAFDATGLAEELRRRAIDRIFVVGLAEEVCVKASAIDAAQARLRDACAARRDASRHAAGRRGGASGDARARRDSDRGGVTAPYREARRT